MVYRGHFMLKILDLCCGIGGFPLAFRGQGEVVLASDWDAQCKITYEHNFKGHKFVADLYDIKIDKIPVYDILCAGFPCQPFSIAGSQQGFDHETQGNIFFRICEIIKGTKPQVVFLENVKNLLSHEDGNTFKVIEKSLKKLGYHIQYQVLNATKYGNLPQNRERIYIVGFLDDEACEKFKFPNEIPLTKKLFGDIIDITMKGDAKLYQNNLNSPSIKKMKDSITEKNVVYQYRRYTVRKNMSGECPTLTANMGSGGHNVPLILDNFGIRKLSVFECFKLQGFPVPNDYKIPPEVSNSNLYHQIGNSIPVSVVQRIASNIIKALDGHIL
jgi:DNA (cytosine-5)-methyltransferase 1